ncbi:TMF family protein [Salmonirosea aquatica]|uniref:TMF family protein n=1 Tax=Salmonirosea aquatica TaxID=2654236 RepID=A0A7C9FA78_9BACT|nr:TMF family protein [Cytophagaceae bacterium SJW1-29]
MKTKFTLTLGLLSCALTGMAQNQITTPTGQPLVIGNQGVKLSNLNSGSATQPTNGKVLSVDANGLIFLAPDAGGTPSQFTNNGANIYFNTGNVGLGTDTPLQRLDVNGSINIPTGNTLRVNNMTFLSANGTDNAFLGFRAGEANTTGTSNLFIGSSSGLSNSSGNHNTFLGEASGYLTSSGSDNTFLGRGSGYDNTVGDYNVYVGRATGLGVTNGYANTFIGDFSSSNVSNVSYSTAIGEGARVNCNNCLVLGRAGVKTGINVSSPTALLHVNAASSATAGIRFENLPTSTGTTYPLVVDGSGNLMRSSSASAREASESLDRHWTLTADDHLINNNAGGIMIGTGLSSTPAGYKLYVSDGILAERVKVAVKSTADWRDNVLQDDYQLRSVEDVASFIKENKHLPGVPSAQEMVENGNDLQKTDAVLLEKVEEMMLYIIELKKENTTLKTQIQRIEQKLNEQK